MKNITSLLVVLLFFAMNNISVRGQSLKISASPDRVYTAIDIPFDRVATIKPKSTSETTSKYWTIGCETVDRDYTIYDEYKEYLSPLGFRKARFQAGWAKTEKQKGIYNFDWIDKIVDDMASRNMELWMELSYGNPIYPGGGGYDLGAGLPVSEEALKAWDKWVETMVTRYKGKIHEWEIWNEPDLRSVKHEITDDEPEHRAKADANSPEGLAMFNLRTAKIIKRIDPEAKIAGLAIVRLEKLEYIEKYLQVFKENNSLDLLEWISFHGYPYNPDDMYTKLGVEDNLKKARELVASYSPNLKLRQGESGCPSEYPVKHHALRNYNWTELTQAKWFLRRMMGDMGNDIPDASVFCIMDMTYLYKAGTPEQYKFYNRFGLLRADSVKQVEKIKQSYYAVQNVISAFDQPLVRVKDAKCKVKAANEITSYVYKNKENGKKVIVMWDGTQIPADSYKTQKATVSIENSGFTDPVWIDLLSGRVYKISFSSWKRVGNSETFEVPVYDSPVLITDRNTILTQEYKKCQD